MEIYIQLQCWNYQIIKGVWLQKEDDEGIGKPAEEKFKDVNI